MRVGCSHNNTLKTGGINSIDPTGNLFLVHQADLRFKVCLFHSIVLDGLGTSEIKSNSKTNPE